MNFKYQNIAGNELTEKVDQKASLEIIFRNSATEYSFDIRCDGCPIVSFYLHQCSLGFLYAYEYTYSLEPTEAKPTLHRTMKGLKLDIKNRVSSFVNSWYISQDA